MIKKIHYSQQKTDELCEVDLQLVIPTQLNQSVISGFTLFFNTIMDKYKKGQQLTLSEKFLILPYIEDKKILLKIIENNEFLKSIYYINEHLSENLNIILDELKENYEVKC